MIDWKSDAQGIVTLSFDDPMRSANTINSAYRTAMSAVLDRVAAEKEDIKGVILTSAKETFFAGADVGEIIAWGPDDIATATDFVTDVKSQLRLLETIGVPVVAAINGTALGGGYELALACHHRIVLDRKHIKLGLPEVRLGLLPGGGGVVRSVRLLGVTKALESMLLSGRSYTPVQALEAGLVDEIAATPAELIDKARTWLLSHPDATAPWDAPGYAIPGGTPKDPALMAVLPALAGRLRATKNGAPMPAEQNVLCAAVEGSQVDFETASRIETRYFIDLVTGQVAKNIVQGTFLDMRTIKSGASRPKGYEKHRATTVAVIGAGLMGAGIAYSAAEVGMTVLLKDVDADAAARGKAYAEKAVARAVKRAKLTQDDGERLLDRIIAVTDPGALTGADLVIEAVFEDPELKKRVFAEVEPHVAPDAVLASNTSTLPITELAHGVSRPADFIGLHFFSPVEQMDLVEVIAGEQTSDETLAKAIDIVRQFRKVPIVVNDARGFFTSRVILHRLLEAAAMVAEGIAPATIEQASRQAGYPMGTLALLDEVTLALPRKIRSQFAAAAQDAGFDLPAHPGDEVLAVMVDKEGRPGRAAGAGFYDYDGRSRVGLWAGLKELFPVVGRDHDLDDRDGELDDLKERLLFSEALESARCLSEGVLRSSADANVGSLMGIGYPQWTGGVLQFIVGYPGGIDGFVARARGLAVEYGDRFLPPAFLVGRTTPIELLQGIAIAPTEVAVR